jgi:hypothetical protein
MSPQSYLSRLSSGVLELALPEVQEQPEVRPHLVVISQRQAVMVVVWGRQDQPTALYLIWATQEKNAQEPIFLFQFPERGRRDRCLYLQDS